MSEQGQCSSCGKPVLWIRDQNGTRLPLNVVRVRTYYNVGGGWHFNADVEEKAVLRYISHFVTCPNASKHSKKGKTP